MKEELMKCRNVFKWVSFGLLMLVVLTISISMIWQANTNAMILNGETTKELLQQEGIYNIADKIYIINSALCISSIISAMVHIGLTYLLKTDSTYNSKRYKKSSNENNYKTVLKKNWPCVLLVVFMLWTAVGCIQASTEASAEALVRSDAEKMIKITDDIENGKLKKDEAVEKELRELKARLEKNLKIANWSSGDRMTNAADRGWNGCTNLKDGYFSFLFYAMVLVNVIMLGANSGNLKKWILRALLITSLILAFTAFLNLLNPETLYGIVFYHRAMFNNSNHFGYYLCISAMLCATMFLKDKNIFFKGISLIGFALISFMLIVNNTFGAYLGVMIALGIVFICTLISLIHRVIDTFIKSDNSEEIKKDCFNAMSEFAKISIVVAIFTFFSCTVTGAESKIYMEGTVYCQRSYIGFTFAGRTLYKEDGGSKIKASEIAYKNSGDNRVYTRDEQEYALITSVKDFDSGSKLYEINKLPYKMVKDESTTTVSEEGTFSTETIVERNFNQLFKDIDIIFAQKEELKNNITINSESGDFGKTISGEWVTSFSGENSGENVKEEYNEKSGLSEAVSNTGSGRGEVWIKSLDLMEQRPLFGWGLENLLNEFYTQYNINEGRTHNLVLQLAGTTGVVGMWLYIGAVIAIFFKVLFDFELRKHNKEMKLRLLGIYTVLGVIAFVIFRNTIGVILIDFSLVVLLETIIVLLTNVKKAKLRISKWGLIEYVTVPAFIAYMISSLFGNSAFYTSPYFMIILGMMTASMIYKKEIDNEEVKDLAGVSEK